MPKQKTHKGLAKRVKVTGTGKVKRRRSMTGHLLSVRPAKKRRMLRRAAILSKSDERRTLRALGR
jgi:large subunit ribosomal protein L35